MAYIEKNNRSAAIYEKVLCAVIIPARVEEERQLRAFRLKVSTKKPTHNFFFEIQLCTRTHFTSTKDHAQRVCQQTLGTQSCNPESSGSLVSERLTASVEKPWVIEMFSSS